MAATMRRRVADGSSMARAAVTAPTTPLYGVAVYGRANYGTTAVDQPSMTRRLASGATMTGRAADGATMNRRIATRATMKRGT